MVLSLRELVNEDWWDDMSPEDQAAYIKKHPGSKQAQQAGGDEPEKITKGPGGYGDRGNVRGQDQAYSGEPDDEEYFKSMMGPDTKTDIFGNVPEDPDVDPYGDDDDDWETHGGGPSFWDSPTPGNEPSQDDLDSQIAQAQKDADDANQMAQQFGGMTQGGDSRYDDAAAEANKKLRDLEKQKSAARTGKELNQETITVDGKQFRRISEGVEKQPKPKYEFSEFYERFKR